MKKIVSITCALLIGGFVVQAQEDSELVGTSITNSTQTTKVVVKKETAPVVKSNVQNNADAMDATGDAATKVDMQKVKAEQERKAAVMRAEKRAKQRADFKAKKTTGVETSKARVITQEKQDAEKMKKMDLEKLKKLKKATEKDN